MCMVKIAFMTSKAIASLAVIGFGLYGLGIDNPIMNMMSGCGDWWFMALVVAGVMNLAAMLWWGILRKKDCCKEQCGKQK